MVVCALVTGAILVFIYIVTSGFLHSDFIDRLTQQSSLEVLHFATPDVRDVMPAGSFNILNPATSIYDAGQNLLHSQGSYPIPEPWVIYLRDHEIFNAERGEYTTVGRRHFVNGRLYLVFVSAKDLPAERELNLLLKAMIAGWLISLMLSYITGLYFSGNALRPMTRVVQEVNQITEDNLSYRLNFDKDMKAVDEIDELILTFNELLSRIERAFIAQRRFVHNASHELKTPLTAIMAEVELALARQRSNEAYRQTLETVKSETERLTHITKELLTLALLEEGSSKAEMETINVLELVKKTKTSFMLHHPEREVALEHDGAEIFVMGNMQLLQTALLNILDNAYKYSSDLIKIVIGHLDEEVVISIQDTGIGIPVAEFPKIHTPLFRASNARSRPGAGLGLPLVQRIMEVHHGKLEIVSREGEGTNCMVRLKQVGYNPE